MRWALLTLFLASSAVLGADPDLLLYLPLNGKAEDVGPAHHATRLDGARPVTDRFQTRAGALVFRDDASVQVLDVKPFQRLSEFTLSAWVHPEARWHHCNIVSLCTPGRDFNLQVNREGHLVSHSSIDADRYEFCVSERVLPLRQWSFVAVTYKDQEWTLYVNGQPDRRLKAQNPPPWTGNRLTVGNLAPGSEETFRGALDDVRIHRRALSAKEIARLQNVR